jgi:hypothetical protein
MMERMRSVLVMFLQMVSLVAFLREVSIEIAREGL